MKVIGRHFEGRKNGKDSQYNVRFYVTMSIYTPIERIPLLLSRFHADITAGAAMRKRGALKWR